MRFTRMRLALAVLLLASMPARGGETSEKLVPARWGAKTDSQGFNWDIQPQSGIIGDGSNDCFDSAGEIRINGNRQNYPQAQMTADGAEYVISGKNQEMSFTRRILVDNVRAGVRYLDTITNDSAKDMSIKVEFITGLGNQASQCIANDGNAFNGTLDPKNAGFITISTDQRPCVMFLVAAPKNKCRPNIATENNRRFVFTYTLQIKPKESSSLIHWIAQRRLQQGVPPTPKTAKDLFKPFFNGRLVKPAVPDALRKQVLNFTMGDAFEQVVGNAFPELEAALDDLGIERGSEDMLATDSSTRLAGTAQWDKLTFESSLGKTELSMQDVMLLQGGGGAGRQMKAFLRTGEILTGQAEGKIDFKGKDGLHIPLEMATLESLALRLDAASRDAKQPVNGPYLYMHAGDKLQIANPDILITAITPWGALPVKLGEVDWLMVVDEPVPGYRLRLKDGSSFPAFLKQEKLKASSARFPQAEISPLEIAALGMPSTEPKDNEEKPKAPHFQLAGASFLVGGFAEAKLELVSNKETKAVETSAITSLAQDEGEKANKSFFTAQSNKGETASGLLKGDYLAIKKGEATLYAPVQQVRKFFTPPPAPQPASPAGDAAKTQAGEAGNTQAAK